MSEVSKPHWRLEAIQAAWVEADPEDVGPTLRAAQEDIKYLFEQLESALATIEVLQDKEALSDIIASQTEEHERLLEQFESERAKSIHCYDLWEKAQEQYEVLKSSEAQAWNKAQFETDRASALQEQLEAAQKALREIAYDGPNPGLRRSEELQWASDVARRALASNPASERDELIRRTSRNQGVRRGSDPVSETRVAIWAPDAFPPAPNPASMRDGDPIAEHPGWVWSEAEGRPVWKP